MGGFAIADRIDSGLLKCVLPSTQTTNTLWKNTAIFTRMACLADIVPSLAEDGLSKIGVLRKLLRAARSDDMTLGELPLHASAAIIDVTVRIP